MRPVVAVCTLLPWLLSGIQAFADDIYIDPSRAVGCPGAGLRDDPHCDWREVRNYRGGNRYLQKSGTTYRRTLHMTGNTGASAEQSVVIGAYGAGPRPVIRIENPLPGALDPKSWQRTRHNIWAYSTAGFRIGDPAVLLLDGRRAFGKARQEQDLCAEQGTQIVEWFHADETLSLCSPRGNPAEVYASISGMQRARGDRAWAMGLTLRPAGDTIRDTWQWCGTRPEDYRFRAGLTPQREAEALRALGGNHG